MSTPKRHHFVPRAYLESFVDSEGFLHLYSKHSALWRRQKPEKVMIRNKYYRQNWVPDGVDYNILEKSLAKDLEPNGLTSLNRLVTDADNITDDDTATILNYLEFQRIRVPRQYETAKALAETVTNLMVSQTEEGRNALRYFKINIQDSFRFKFMRTVSGALSPYFSRMVWEVIESEEGSYFVTSDSPVTFLNERFLPPTEPGIALYGTMVVYPISSRHLLLMKHPEYEKGEKEATDALAKNIDIEDGVIELRKHLVWNRDVVNKQNWFMYMQSQDLIAAPSKEVLEDAIGSKIIGYKA
jgi:hypothetical protein